MKIVILALAVFLNCTAFAADQDRVRKNFLKLDHALTLLATGTNDEKSVKEIETIPKFFKSSFLVISAEPVYSKKSIHYLEKKEWFTKKELEKAIETLYTGKTSQRIDFLRYLISKLGRRDNQPLGRLKNTWRWQSGTNLPRSAQNEITFSKDGKVKSFRITYYHDV